MRTRPLLAALAATATLGIAGAAAAATWPDRLDLPAGWQPEGIASGRSDELFVGSIATGDIWRFRARTGTGKRLFDAKDGSSAIGLEVGPDRRLYVAGGATGRGTVYDLGAGGGVADFRFTTKKDTFVNDVAVTRRAAYFTDSRRSVLYVVDTRRLDRVRRLPLPGIPAGDGINLNGIEASADGSRLIAVATNTGVLWRIDAATGKARQVDVGAKLMNGDGLLLVGRRLYVVRNQDNEVVVVKLAADWRSGRVVKTIRSDDFAIPTTAAAIGRRLYVVNARFGTPTDPPADYWVTQVRR